MARVRSQWLPVTRQQVGWLRTVIRNASRSVNQEACFHRAVLGNRYRGFKGGVDLLPRCHEEILAKRSFCAEQVLPPTCRIIYKMIRAGRQSSHEESTWDPPALRAASAVIGVIGVNLLSKNKRHIRSSAVTFLSLFEQHDSLATSSASQKLATKRMRSSGSGNAF